jgi:ubiquinone/menaquinone biosynthesis C-methylase UbiE
MMRLGDKQILDVGCGSGQQLLDMESWGARRENLAGIDLIASRVSYACSRLCTLPAGINPGADIRVGDASKLPWPEATFDIVHQNTVLTSILDDGMKKAVAAEML